MNFPNRTPITMVFSMFPPCDCPVVRPTYGSAKEYGTKLANKPNRKKKRKK